MGERNNPKLTVNIMGLEANPETVVSRAAYVAETEGGNLVLATVLRKTGVGHLTMDQVCDLLRDSFGFNVIGHTTDMTPGDGWLLAEAATFKSQDDTRILVMRSTIQPDCLVRIPVTGPWAMTIYAEDMTSSGLYSFVGTERDTRR